jgi:hypothetical protein
MKTYRVSRTVNQWVDIEVDEEFAEEDAYNQAYSLDADQWDEEVISEQCDELDVDDYYDDSMDGDHDSAMASAGFGTDEDYGG